MSNVRNLRPAARPYDHERDDEQIWVQLHPLEWSVIKEACEWSEIRAAWEAADKMAEQVQTVQLARINADIRDETT
jgi:hypothetical protein